MATEINRSISPLEMQRLQTSIKYHDWFLGFVVVVGVTLSIYLIDAMNALQDGLADVRTRIVLLQKDVDVMQEDIDVMQEKIEGILKDINTLNQKMDRYHSNSGL